MIWLPIYGEKGGRKREKRYGIVVRAIPANITNSFYRLFNENFAGKEERWRLRSDIKVRGFWGGLLLSVLWFGFKFLFTLLLIVMAIGEWSLVGWKMRRFPRAGLLGRVALRRYDGGDFALSDRLDGCRTEQKKLSCSCRLCGAFSFFCLFFPYGNGAGTNHLFFPSLRLGCRFAKMPGRLFCVDGGRRMPV